MLRSRGTKPLMLSSRTVQDRDTSCTNRASSCSPDQAQQNPRKSGCSEQRMLKGWGSADPPVLPKAKGSPRHLTLHPPGSSAPARQGDEEAGRVLLPVQTAARLFSLFTQLLNTSPQETVCPGGQRLGQGGCPVLPGTVPAPRGPNTLQFTAQGWIQTNKNGSSERGARAHRPAETCLSACNYHRPLHPRSYFGAATGHPCAHPRTLSGADAPCALGKMLSRILRTPVCAGEAIWCNLCPRLSPGTPRAALWPLAAPTSVSHRAELSQGRCTSRDLPRSGGSRCRTFPS